MSDTNQQMDMSWSAIRFPMTRGEHQIVLELAMWSSRERLWVNDECILERKSWRFQNSHVFELDGEMISLTSRPRLLGLSRSSPPTPTHWASVHSGPSQRR